jgi:hypothetical protein
MRPLADLPPAFQAGIIPLLAGIMPDFDAIIEIENQWVTKAVGVVIASPVARSAILAIEAGFGLYLVSGGLPFRLAYHRRVIIEDGLPDRHPHLKLNLFAERSFFRYQLVR